MAGDNFPKINHDSPRAYKKTSDFVPTERKPSPENVARAPRKATMKSTMTLGTFCCQAWRTMVDFEGEF